MAIGFAWGLASLNEGKTFISISAVDYACPRVTSGQTCRSRLVAQFLCKKTCMAAIWKYTTTAVNDIMNDLLMYSY